MVIAVQKNPHTGYFHVTFSLRQFRGASRRIVIAGTFNAWSTEYVPPTSGIVHAPDRDKAITIELPPGYHEYKHYDASRQCWMEIEREPDIYHAEDQPFTGNPFGTLNCWLWLE